MGLIKFKHLEFLCGGCVLPECNENHRRCKIKIGKNAIWRKERAEKLATYRKTKEYFRRMYDKRAAVEPGARTAYWREYKRNKKTEKVGEVTA